MTDRSSLRRGKWTQPESLRARFGLGDTRNGFHGSGESKHCLKTPSDEELTPSLSSTDSPESAARELGQVFDDWDCEWWLAQQEKEQ